MCARLDSARLDCLRIGPRGVSTSTVCRSLSLQVDFAPLLISDRHDWSYAELKRELYAEPQHSAIHAQRSAWIQDRRRTASLMQQQKAPEQQASEI